MNITTYNRYSKFTQKGTVKLVPFIEMPIKDSDMYEVYELGKSRLDLISYQYYNNPNYGWLILLANPELGSLEFNIPNKSLLRIPYPLDVSLMQYEEGIKEYNKLNE